MATEVRARLFMDLRRARAQRGFAHPVAGRH